MPDQQDIYIDQLLAQHTIFYQNLQYREKKQANLLYSSENGISTTELLKFRPNVVKNNKYKTLTVRSTTPKQEQKSNILDKKANIYCVPKQEQQTRLL